MSDADQGGAGRREVAYRIFAAEYDDADLSYSESDEERAPNYVVSPTGARINRLFVVGVLTEVETVSDDVLRARVVDPTGAFVLYAGQYQPDEQAFLERADPPTFVAVTGKARTFQPEDSDRVFTSVRPESISEVDAETRDRWTVQTAEQTVRRVGRMAAALSMDRRGEELAEALRERGVDDGLAAGIPLAIDHYRTTPTYLAAIRGMALDAARLVAGEIEEVEPPSVSPDATGDVAAESLAETDLEPAAVDSEPGASAGAEPEPADSDETAGGAADGTAGEAAPEAGAEPEGSASQAAEPSPGEEVTSAEPVGTDAAEESPTETAGEGGEEIGDFDPGEFDLDEEEREEIEEEFGTEFQSGTEVDEPGTADIETPEPEESGEPATDVEAGSEAESTPPAEEADETAPEPGDEGTATDTPEESSDDEPAEAEVEPADMTDAVVDIMTELDDGSGVERSDVIEAIVDRYGASPEEVEDAIQDALMDGRCYEPDDTTLKPI